MDITQFPTQQITLKQLTAEIGGLHVDRPKRANFQHIKVAQWLLDHGTYIGGGIAGAVYAVRLADCQVAVKAGFVFYTEAQAQDAVAREIQGAPQVFSYLRDLDLAEQYDWMVCPYHGPKERRQNKWKKQDAPCHCHYPKDLLVMELCDREISRAEMTPEVAAHRDKLWSRAFDISKRAVKESSEMKTTMWLHGRMVLVDFGDHTDMEGMNLKK